MASQKTVARRKRSSIDAGQKQHPPKPSAVPGKRAKAKPSRKKNHHFKFGFRFTMSQAHASKFIVPVLLSVAGMYDKNPSLWYDTLLKLSGFLCFGVLLLCAVWEFLSYYLASPMPGHRLQNKKTEPPMYADEAKETLLCMYCVACFTVWPTVSMLRGEPTAFKVTLEECVPAMFRGNAAAAYIGKMVLTLLVADTHTFWKHYFLHNPTFYVFHKSHHKFHNPSTFACFAIHPVEAVWTFWPILLICVPHVFFDGLTGLYLPYHLPFLISFSLLNLYLHCGYRISVLEWVLPRLFVNTSEWHNKHHELSVSHFGEMLTLWDHILGTHTGHWSKKKYESQMKKVVMGQSGMDEQMH